MSQLNRTYGSMYHFASYRRVAAPILDRAIAATAGFEPDHIEWLYPVSGDTRPEFAGLSFLSMDRRQQDLWEDFWPKSGTPPTWDGIARIPSSGTWLLVEAKANHPEFCSPPCGATSKESIQTIKRSLDETKVALGVHRFFRWDGTYYQYANRLAILHFLAKLGVHARLVFLYFYGDQFPDGTPCPKSAEDWKELIHACHLTLGLEPNHRLSPWIHDVFLPVPAPAISDFKVPVSALLG